MAKRAKSVFTEQDFEDLMPPSLERPVDAPAPTSITAPAAPAAPAASAGPAVDSPAPAPGPVPQAPRHSEPRPASRRRAAVSAPTSEVAPNVFRLLRRLTTREKGRDPISARTYAQVVMDAIEAHQTELATHWQTPAEPEGGGGLFSRRPAAPARRRRHAEPPARVPLTGLNPTDAETLNRLVGTWAAPSRSALVEQALRLYLNAD